MVILVTLLQVLALPFAGMTMYWQWKRIASSGRWIAMLVTGGFLFRAAFGLVLFWASFLPLNLPAGVEDDNGFWFYAWDARTYFRSACEIAAAGPWAILSYPSQSAAVFFVKILASFVLVFGHSAAVGLLMNLFAYLTTCVALLSLFPGESRTTKVAIGALSFSPSLILWTLQPLKDVVFLCLVAAFVAMAFLWQGLWRVTPERASGWRKAGVGVGLVFLLYGVAGIRWYFAFLLLNTSLLFFALSSLRARSWKSGLVSLVVFSGMVGAFFAGGGAYIPEPLWTLLRPATAISSVVDLPAFLRGKIVGTRIGFKNTAANTDIMSPEERSAPSPSVTAQDAISPGSTETSQPVSARGSERKPVATVAAGGLPKRDTGPRSAQRELPPVGHEPNPPSSSSHSNDPASDRVEVANRKPVPLSELTTSPANGPVAVSVFEPPPAVPPPSAVGRLEHSAAGGQDQPATPVGQDQPATPVGQDQPATPAGKDQPPTPVGQVQTAPPVEPEQPASIVEQHSKPVAATSGDHSTVTGEAVSVAPSEVPRNRTGENVLILPGSERAAINSSAGVSPPAVTTKVPVVPRSVRRTRSTAGGPAPTEASGVLNPPAQSDPSLAESATAPMPRDAGRQAAVDEESAGAAQFREASSPAGVSSHASQLVVGVSAMLLPRFAGKALGLFSAGGSRALWLFAEIDTFYFDAVLLLAVFALIGGVRQGGWRNPSLALVVLTTAVIGGMLAYTITNFGTLFRHRGMVFIGLVMIPLIVASERARLGSGTAAPAGPAKPSADDGGNRDPH
jgi:hypothetical protein